eukprot:Gb_07934 [translate_table: standard]
MIEGVKEDLKKNFEMTDLGLLHYCLGVEVWQRPGGKLSANDEEKLVDGTLFCQLVGSLIYLTTTKPDIIFTVGVISIYMTSPK